MSRSILADFVGVPAFRVTRPPVQRLPVVLASPHSGTHYTREFLEQSRLPERALRASEDAFVDRLFTYAATSLGVPMLRATFPRSYVDVNREPFELDPDMFVEKLPAYVNHASSKVHHGLGVVPRIAGDGDEIYAGRLHFADALARIDRLYLPYHQALSRLIDQTVAKFGVCLLIDCHSMPSALQPEGPGGFDAVLGDLHGAACDRRITDTAESTLLRQGMRAVRNDPFAGGFVTRHYGRPERGVHVLQIELARDLYMDEATLTPTADLPHLARQMALLVANLGRVPNAPKRRPKIAPTSPVLPAGLLA